MWQGQRSSAACRLRVLIAFFACVVLTQSRPIGSNRRSTTTPTSFIRIPGNKQDVCLLNLQTRLPPYGGFTEYTADDPDDDRHHRHPKHPSNSHDAHRRDDHLSQRQQPKRRQSHKQKSSIQSLAEKSIQLTTKTALGTVKQSGKAAYYLVKPKHVEKNELIGLWRLDQQILPNYRNDAIPVECSANIELTRDSVLVTVASDERNENDDDTAATTTTRTLETPWKFYPAKWPRAAKVEFAAKAFVVESLRGGGGSKEQLLFFYKGQVDRKLADRSVIKIKGKIFRIEKAGWRGKEYKYVPVGTFVARRRMKLEPHDSDQNDQDDEDDVSGWDNSDEEENYRESDDGDEGKSDNGQ